MFRPRLLSKPSPLVWTTASLLTLIAAGGVALYPSSALAGGRPPLSTRPSVVRGLASEVEAATGYAPSQLTNKPVCSAPAAGRMSCRAEILAVKSSGRSVVLRWRPYATPETFRSAHAPAVTNGEDPAHSGAVRPDGSGLAAVAAPQPFSPAYLQWAYDLTWLSGTSGSGDTVAVVDAYDDPNAAADLAQFRQEYGLYPCAATADANDCLTAMSTAGPPTTGDPNGSPIFEQYNQSGQVIDRFRRTAPQADATGEWELEESLDVDAVSSLCPQCTIDLVEANSDLGQDLQAAANEADALDPTQLSMSWGDDANEGCDTGTWWYPGVSSLAAAGDYGYQGPSSAVQQCDPRAQYDGNSVSYPAAYSQVTSVGGTTLTQADTPRGFVESVWGGQPELSGGYFEATQSGCDTSQSVPSYQNPPYGLGGCAGRAYNDVSGDADPASGLAVYDSYGGDDNDAYGCDTVNDPGSCVVGGTSLSTPLTAAYEALVGISPTQDPADSPAWAYSDAPYLNDITTGNDDTLDLCLSAQAIICQAGAGWDGPTGNGSISGDLVPGAPGIGGAYESAETASTPDTVDVSVAGGVYPNDGTTSDATSFSWEYGLDPTNERPATAVDADGDTSTSGSALTPVTGTFEGLPVCATYHFQLDASNSVESVDGYDNTLLTTAPSVSDGPSISGTAIAGSELTGGGGDWSTNTDCTTDYAYQWEETDGDGDYQPIPGATGTTYQLGSSDVGNSVELAVTATSTNSAAGTSASVTAVSDPVGPIVAAGPNKDVSSTTTTPAPPTTTSTTTTSGTSVTASTTTTTSTTATTTTVAQTKSATSAAAAPKEPAVVKAPTITSTSEVGGTITVGGGSYTNATGELVQFLRCAHTCVPLKTSGAPRYTLTTADAGHYVEVKLSVHGAAGTVPLSSTNWVGPVTDAGTGALAITTGARIAASLEVRSSTGVALATVTVVKRTRKGLKLEVTRSTGAPTSTWVCVSTGATWDSCTVARSVKGALPVSVAIKPGQTVRVIALRTVAAARPLKEAK